jgi:selenium metabolism protein YedF
MTNDRSTGAGRATEEKPEGGSQMPDITVGQISVTKPKVILLGSDSMGRGDDQLGKLLMANFLRLLGEDGKQPGFICLVNSGVRLATQGNLCIEHVKKLDSLGTTVLICRTCLEYLDIEDQVAVGKVSNMMEIQATLLAGEVLSL